MTQNTLLKVLEQLLHKIKANRRREIGCLLKYGESNNCRGAKVGRKDKLL